MSQNIVHIENLVKRYGDLAALNHLNLDIVGYRERLVSGKLRFSDKCVLFRSD